MTRDEERAARGAGLEEVDWTELAAVTGGCNQCTCSNDRGNNKALAFLLPCLLGGQGFQGRRR